MTMQTADIELALGGDRGNTIWKSGVTVAEIVVLQAIHGQDSVMNITPRGSIDRGVREEKARLAELYRANDSERRLIVENVYPGAAPVMHKTFEDLDLPPELFAAETRVSTDAPAPKRKSKKAEPAPPEPAADGEIDDLDDVMN